MSEDILKGYDHDAAPSAENGSICKHCGGAIISNPSDWSKKRLYPANEVELDREMLDAQKKALEDAVD